MNKYQQAQAQNIRVWFRRFNITTSQVDVITDLAKAGRSGSVLFAPLEVTLRELRKLRGQAPAEASVKLAASLAAAVIRGKNTDINEALEHSDIGTNDPTVALRMANELMDVRFADKNRNRRTFMGHVLHKVRK